METAEMVLAALTDYAYCNIIIMFSQTICSSRPRKSQKISDAWKTTAIVREEYILIYCQQKSCLFYRNST